MTWVDDLIGILAFACMGLLVLLLVVAVGMAVFGITPFAWFIPVTYGLVAAFAFLVVISELI